MEHEPREATTRSRSRWLKRFGVFFLGLAVLIALIYASISLQVNRERAEWTAKFEEAGYPTTMEEHIATYGPISEEEDAAPLYAAAFEAVKNADPNDLSYGAIEDIRRMMKDEGLDRPTEEYRAQARAYVAAAQDALAAIRRAAEVPRARFDIKLELGPEAQLDHLSSMRQLARTLILDIEVATWEGNTQRVVDNIHTTLKIARALEEEPLLISSLVAIRIQGIAVEQLPAIFESGVLGDDDLQRLSEAFEREPYLPMMKRALAGELRWMDLDPSAEVPDPEFGIVPRFLRGTWYRYEHNVMSDYMDALLLAPDQPWPSLLDIADANEEEGLRPSILASITMPALARSAYAFARAAANARIARVAIAVERFRLKEGRLPYEAAELKPYFPNGYPTDPFDGRPIRYITTPTGYTVYCVSMNRTDDHGELNWATGDWGLEVRHEDARE